MKITLPTNFDLTPAGKRSARYVQASRGSQLRWYVGGRLYRKGAPAHLTAEWLANEGAPDHLPQKWS